MNYNYEINDFEQPSGVLATCTQIREAYADVMKRSFNHAVIIVNGDELEPADLVTAVANVYGVDRHELGTIIGKLQLTALLEDTAVAEELEAHGVDRAGVAS